MMEYDIREAKKSDSPAIMELLRRCMGDALHLDTPDDWHWKHYDNPFGSSEILLAERDGNIIGLRAFMRWRWQWKEETYEALRPVDTATHPEYRRKGIFKTLTVQLVDRCRDKGYDFIFNNPNENSLPGYLKMGWEKWTKPPLRIQLIRPLDMMTTLLTGAANEPEIRGKHRLSEDVIEAWEAGEAEHDQYSMHTPFTRDFVRWRYLHCPVYEYGAVRERNALLIFRLQKTRFGPALRVCDWKWKQGSPFDDIRTLWRELLSSYPVHFATLPSYFGTLAKKLQRKEWQFEHRSINPQLVFHPLNTKLDFLPGVNLWDFNSGILEIF